MEKFARNSILKSFCGGPARSGLTFSLFSPKNMIRVLFKPDRDGDDDRTQQGLILFGCFS